MNKKKPYILPKTKAMQVADPVYRWGRDEDERILHELIEESMKSEPKAPITEKRKGHGHRKARS